MTSCDAGTNDDAGQLCHLGGLLIDDLVYSSILHVISWSSHKSRRPVKSTGAAETFAAGEGIETRKLLADAYCTLLQAAIDRTIVVDCKDLYTTLTTERQSIDRPTRGDIGVIRYEFEMRNAAKVTLLPGKINPTDGVLNLIALQSP